MTTYPWTTKRYFWRASSRKLRKKVAAFGRASLRLAVVATAGDEMQVVSAVVAMQALRHLTTVETGVLVWRDVGLCSMVR